MRITHSDGQSTTTDHGIVAALQQIADKHGVSPADLVTDAGTARTLVWLSEAAADNDDGKNAVAEIRLPTKMKIKRTAKSETSAREILAYIQGDEDTTASRPDGVISISENGDLLFYNAAGGTDDRETVLIDRLESDSMGAGWESATPADVIDWLEKNCDA